MGLTIVSLKLLARLHETGVLTKPDAVVEIGAQQLANDFLRARDRMEDLGRLFGVTTKLILPAPVTSAPPEGATEHLPATAPPARLFWEWLGFEYASIDIDGSPNSIPLDLNFDAAPEWARKKFGLVTNFGSTEHIANQLNAFKVIHDLLRPGGIMIHTVPAQGNFNHGLVNYNPKWFWMLARSNDYRWLYFNFAHHCTAEFPVNVVEAAMPYAPDIAERALRYKFTDSGVHVILQKVRDIEFVPPLDVATGTKTTNKALIDRYWTVLAPA